MVFLILLTKNAKMIINYAITIIWKVLLKKEEYLEVYSSFNGLKKTSLIKENLKVRRVIKIWNILEDELSLVRCLNFYLVEMNEWN